MPTEDAQILIREYIRLTLTEGVPKQGYDPEIARRLLNSLARNVSQSVTFETLRKDMYGTEEHLDDFISASKVSKYVAMFTHRGRTAWHQSTRTAQRLADFRTVV